MPCTPGNILFLLLATLATATPATPARSDESRIDDVDRIVAISDIHGDYGAMVSTLAKAGILDDNFSWVGGETHLVIVGDILDRGPESRAAMELLMRLEGEAEAAAGRVHVLIGNHESMLLIGDMRYVSAAEYAAFADEQDPADRDRWFALFATRNQKAPDDALRAEFDKKFPPGFFAMRRAFGAEGKYGAWLLQKNIVAVINGTAFVHGGLSPDTGKIGLDGINVGMRQDLTNYIHALNHLTEAEVLLPTDSHYDYAAIVTDYVPSLADSAELLDALSVVQGFDKTQVLATDGPLWYRRNVSCPGIMEVHRLEEALAGIGADRLVVGHTPTPNRQVLQRFDGRMIEIDTGMLGFYYNGSGNALIMEHGELSVMNQFGAGASVPIPHPRRVGQRPDALSADELQALLQHGEITALAALTSAAPENLLTISDGKREVTAMFSKRKGKGVYPGVAAYRLDRLLDLDMVPVTVMREVDGVSGSLQFMPENRTDEAGRSAAGSGGGATCPIVEQWAAMYVFDTLIYDVGRSPRRILYDLSSWRLMLSENDGAFANKKGRPPHLKNAPMDITAGWEKALLELTDAVLAENFGDILDKRRLRALAARRDYLLAGAEDPTSSQPRYTRSRP